MEAATSVKGNLPSEDKEKTSGGIGDPLQAIQVRPHLIPVPRWELTQRQGGAPQSASSLAVAGAGQCRSSAPTMSDRTISSKKAGFGQQHGKQQSEYLGQSADTGHWQV